MPTTVHLDINDTIMVKPHKGLRSEAILKLSDACDVFVTLENLIEIRKAIDEHLGLPGKEFDSQNSETENNFQKK